ncbi:hypothetical protein BLNAU_20986 [Blattamonas nauphoetae]|uniref:PASTA domain-containing protein n=1 Tax=Blattamonas nauphoetae TaxID=2049346 RepID=A0ABQ9WX56_9EUKA|nr:hypothetical protein BLNAU_20986 [Blattamonas nauphoetae]
MKDETSEYCDVTVTALGIRQQLVFEPKKQFFQPVPLGFTTRARRLIRNVGYELTDVQCQPSGDSQMPVGTQEFGFVRSILVKDVRVQLLISPLRWRPPEDK